MKQAEEYTVAYLVVGQSVDLRHDGRLVGVDKEMDSDSEVSMPCELVCSGVWVPVRCKQISRLAYVESEGR